MHFLYRLAGLYRHTFTTTCYTYNMTNTDDDFSFAEQNHPLYKSLGNRSLKRVYLNDEKYSGIIINAYNTPQQLFEVETLLAKTYMIDNGPESLDRVQAVKININGVQVDANKIIVSKNRKFVDQFILRQIDTIIPTLGDLITFNSQAQKLYPEKGVYGLLGLKSKEDGNRLQYTLEAAGNSVHFGQEELPTVATKAAFIWERIAGTQAFQNGNKRTAMVAMMVMLHSNGYDFMFHPNMKQELVSFSIKIAEKAVDLEQIKEYIIKNCRINTRHETWNTLQLLQQDPTKPTQWG